MPSMIDGERLLRDLELARKYWTEQAADPATEKLEWTRGVIYGIGLCLRLLNTRSF